MDFKELLKTLLGLTLLLFVLTALRKGISFLAGRYNVSGVVSFLA